MEYVNRTIVREFILLAFSNSDHFQILLFTIILLSYIVCILGNALIIILISLEPSLHTPMYIFITTFAILEIMFISVTIPRLLGNLIAENKRISFIGCFAQLYSFNALGETECFILTIMVFDRYLAIQKPLHYSSIMTHSFCVQLAIFPWTVSFVLSFIVTFFTARMEFCGPNEVNHFFCDLAPLQNLACSDAFVSNVVTSSAAIFAIIIPFSIIMGFYIFIITTVLKIKSSDGKKKAFSTCSSHLIMTILFFGTAFIVYVRPKGSQYDKFLALIYTVVTPLLNPFIYTLRNRDVTNAFLKRIRWFLKQSPTSVPVKKAVS